MKDNISKNRDQRDRALDRNQLLTVGDLETFKIDLLAELNDLLRKFHQVGEPKRWLRSKEVRKMLGGISATTLQSLRVNGLLPYSKIGSLWFYNQDDVMRILESNKSKH